MPEHVATDSTEVAMILIAAELTKATMTTTGDRTPDAVGKAYTEVYEAIWKAFQAEYK